MHPPPHPSSRPLAPRAPQAHILPFFMYQMAAHGRTLREVTCETIEAHHHIRKMHLPMTKLGRGSGHSQDPDACMRSTLVDLLSSLFHKGQTQMERTASKNTQVRWERRHPDEAAHASAEVATAAPEAGDEAADERGDEGEEVAREVFGAPLLEDIEAAERAQQDRGGRGGRDEGGSTSDRRDSSAAATTRPCRHCKDTALPSGFSGTKAHYLADENQAPILICLVGHYHSTAITDIHYYY